MLKKPSNLFFLTIASILLLIADLTLMTTSLIHFGEPDCPKELLK